jgi:hypothetical protein
MIKSYSLLEDGRIFGQLIQNRPKKIFLVGQNLWAKNGRLCLKAAKRGRKIFHSNLY